MPTGSGGVSLSLPPGGAGPHLCSLLGGETQLQAPREVREPAQEGRGGRRSPGSDLMLVPGLGAYDTLPFKLVWTELSVTCTQEHLRSVLGLSSNACHRPRAWVG